MLKQLLESVRGLTQKELKFILAAMLASFLICAGYSLVRPVSNALFITTYGSSALAWAWLATLPFTFLVLALYNRFLPKVSCLALLGGILALIITTNVAASFYLSKVWAFPFLFYLWKDVYVLLLFQQLWAVIHATVNRPRAEALYGLFFAVGALGSIFGSLIPALFARKMGSEPLLLFSIPFAVLLFFVYAFALKHSGIDARLPPTKKRGVREGIRQIGASHVLFFILLIVACMQTASTLLDFQFNSLLERAVLSKDLRTEAVGRVMTIINTLSFFFQLGGGFVLIKLLGVRKIHVGIPATLLVQTGLSLLHPLLGVVTIAFATIKTFDFSLFSIVKEMLYVPLNTDEKFHAKALIDVFAYRSSKAIAAAVIFLCQAQSVLTISRMVSLILFLIVLLWLIRAGLFLKRARVALP